jgi:hypothetical protein
VQGSQIAVGPDGAVYVCYEVFYVGNTRRQFISKSINHGLSFTSPVSATPGFGELSFNSTYRKNSFASMTVSPASTVYLVYADYPSATAGAQVEMIRSTSPGGTAFTSPVAVNDSSAGQQFMPAVAVDANGVVHVSWFDTRNNPKQSSSYDIYASRSDNGSQFLSNTRVTATTIAAGSASFIGDYAGITAASGKAYPAFTSGGFNGGRLKVGILTYP